MRKATITDFSLYSVSVKPLPLPPIRTTMGLRKCPECGNEYERLGRHFTSKETHRPPISDKMNRILTGILMGDGSVRTQYEHPVFRLRITAKDYLKWLKNQCEWLFGDITLDQDASQQAELARKGGMNPQADPTDYNDLYGMRSVPHPDFEQFQHWYGEEGKKYPDGLELSPTVVKHWYVCDGWINYPKTASKGSIGIRVSEKHGDLGKIAAKFKPLGVEPTVINESIRFSLDDTGKLIKAFGDPLPGFEYKWEYEDKEKYMKKKSER